MQRFVIISLLVVFSGCQRHLANGRENKCETFENSVILYAAVPGLWGNGFKAVEDRLGYLKELGVNTVWLWPPINRRAAGEEYGITDYFSIDPSWGTEHELKALVTRAHRLELKIIIDFVPNHTSDRHPYYLDATKKGKASRYYDFYDRTPEGSVTAYFNWTHLPNLNYSNPDVRQWMIDAMQFWVAEYDIDGFRMDMAWAIRERCPGFWPECCRELERIKPDIFMLAEASATDPNYFAAGFDAAYDWRGGPGKWAWEGVFDTTASIQSELAPALTNDGKGFASNGLVLRFINNNDTGERFIERHGPHLTRSASAMQFTLPGIPVIFAGDEIGARYLPSGEVEEVPWEDRFDLLKWYAELIALRSQFPVLRSPELILLNSEPDSVVSYIRKGCDLEPVLVVVNFGAAGVATIELTPEIAALFRDVYDAANDDKRFSFADRGSISIPVEANSLRVLLPMKSNSGSKGGLFTGVSLQRQSRRGL